MLSPSTAPPTPSPTDVVPAESSLETQRFSPGEEINGHATEITCNRMIMKGDLRRIRRFSSWAQRSGQIRHQHWHP